MHVQKCNFWQFGGTAEEGVEYKRKAAKISAKYDLSRKIREKRYVSVLTHIVHTLSNTANFTWKHLIV